MKSVDPVLCQLARQYVQRGYVVWDVGANVGLFSFAAAHLAGETGKVYAFDADVWLVQMLRRSASIQPPSSAAVQILSAAIAECCDIKTFNIAIRSRASNSLQGFGQSQSGGIAEQHLVLSVSIDWLCERLPAPDVIKIDVEGAELGVLRGGVNLLRSKAPVVLCEVSSESSPDVTDLLKNCGYKIYDGETKSIDRRELLTAPWSTIAIRASGALNE